VKNPNATLRGDYPIIWSSKVGSKTYLWDLTALPIRAILRAAEIGNGAAAAHEWPFYPPETRNVDG